MAVKKIRRLLVKFMCLWILGFAASASPERNSQNSNSPPSDFQDHTIRMDGAISSRLPDSNGEYLLLIDTKTNFTCIPYTTTQPRRTHVHISLQNRGQHLDGCDCTLRWNFHADNFQCFCSIPWTFRRPGREVVKCCIDDSYQEDCLHGHSFQIHFIEVTTTVRPTATTSLETTEPPPLPSTSKEVLPTSKEIVSKDVMSSPSPPQSQSTRLMTLQGSSEEQTSIPNVQPESDGNFQKESSSVTESAPWLLPVGASVGVVTLAIAVISVLRVVCTARQAPVQGTPV